MKASSGTTAIATTTADAVDVITHAAAHAQGGVPRHVTIVSAVAGFYSVDGGHAWDRIEANARQTRYDPRLDQQRQGQAGRGDGHDRRLRLGVGVTGMATATLRPNADGATLQDRSSRGGLMLTWLTTSPPVLFDRSSSGSSPEALTRATIWYPAGAAAGSTTG